MLWNAGKRSGLKSDYKKRMLATKAVGRRPCMLTLSCISFRSIQNRRFTVNKCGIQRDSAEFKGIQRNSKGIHLYSEGFSRDSA